MMIDVHAHLSAADFVGDLAACLEKAKKQGVQKIVCVSETVDDAIKLLELSKQYPIIAPCAGIHPEHACTESFERLEKLVREHQKELVGIGEVGLDFSPHIVAESPDSIKETQRQLLYRQASLAVEIGLPLNVHSRSAGHHTIELLQKAGAQAVVMHAFDGRPHYAEMAAEQGYFFSVPPSIVRSPQKQKLVRRLKLENLLLETDSPALGPENGERNVPANISHSRDKIAEIFGVSAEKVAAITTENAKRLFCKLK